ncbi:MAG TPA: UDP-N-acetylmuramate dehydrogenase [Candidatus Eisenbacteria bacterium]|nr:UDP-N-acetylmuramate dehydrogenase [Candidatus Eisenbacteria bacterium]
MTVDPELVRALEAAVPGRVRTNEPLARYTSFRIGGPADVLVSPDTAEELGAVLRLAAEHSTAATMLGGGSNLLVGDGGIRGIVVRLGAGFRHVAWDAPCVEAGAGVQLGRLARDAAQRGLGGLEYAEGIPGTVGGALFMNAGAYGGEVADAVDEVETVDASGRVRRIGRDELAFTYRRTALPAGVVVTAVRFRLRAEAAERVRARMEDARARRTASQPHGSANAGSIFKNPPGDHAGRLVEAAGLKGVRVGGARVSDAHANFIVNDGEARAADVQALMQQAQRVVWEGSGVWLEPEVRLIGSW